MSNQFTSTLRNVNTDWEATFRAWSKPPSDHEQSKAENAERAINQAIREYDGFANMEVRVFPQGSYKANTNVRLDSDVDICVCLKSTFFYEIPTNPPNRPEDYNIIPGTVGYSDFKNLVESALVKKFGRDSVKRGKKAFDVHENSYRLDADVIPAFEHRYYTGEFDSNRRPIYHEGIKFIPDNGWEIINWPEQNYTNGVVKNNNTGCRYKAMVRILKRLRNHMQQNDMKSAENVASFLIESLVWNVPNNNFGNDSFKDDVKNVLAHVFNGTIDDERCKEWGEVNEFKYLFRILQPWTRAQAHNFLSSAWDYVGFE